MLQLNILEILYEELKPENVSLVPTAPKTTFATQHPQPHPHLTSSAILDPNCPPQQQLIYPNHVHYLPTYPPTYLPNYLPTYLSTKQKN